MQLISITVDIAFHSPKAYPITMAILSKLLSLVPDKKAKQRIVSRVLKKFSSIPNTGYLEIWLQRAALSFRSKLGFRETLCRLADGEAVPLWDNQWISCKVLKKMLESPRVINQKKI